MPCVVRGQTRGSVGVVMVAMLRLMVMIHDDARGDHSADEGTDGVQGSDVSSNSESTSNSASSSDTSDSSASDSNSD